MESERTVFFRLVLGLRSREDRDNCRGEAILVIPVILSTHDLLQKKASGENCEDIRSILTLVTADQRTGLQPCLASNDQSRLIEIVIGGQSPPGQGSKA